MANDFFRFKQFTVFQKDVAMKVGVDSVLLGAWVNVDHAYHVLDIGTGTGLLALMLAQRMEQFSIDAIEIDHAACLQANQNSAFSPWNDHIRVICDDFRDFIPELLYDLIITNPPYFKASLKSQDEKRNIARHTDSALHEDMIVKSAKWLLPQGVLAVVLPPSEAQLFMDQAKLQGLYPQRILRVKPHAGKPIYRVFFELSFGEKPIYEEELCIETTQGTFSDEYMSLTQDFYLKF